MSAPTPESFDLADLDRTLSIQDKLVMAETVLAWADLDTGLSRLILLIFGMNEDAGSILVGNMDLKTKVEKIKLLHEHHGYVGAAKKFTKLNTDIRHHSECRNTIAHRKCIGRLISQPSRIVFQSAKHLKKVPGQYEIVCIDHSEMVVSANFARDTAVKIGDMIATIEERNRVAGLA